MREEVCGEAVVSVKYDLAARCASAGCPAWAGGGEPKRRERKEMKKELRGFPPQPLRMTQTLDIIILK